VWAPRDVAANVEGFVRAGSGVISLVTDSDVFETAQRGHCRDYRALVKLASIIAHEEWHVRHGADEAGAYQAQLDALADLGVPLASALHVGVQRAMFIVLDEGPRLVLEEEAIRRAPVGDSADHVVSERTKRLSLPGGHYEFLVPISWPSRIAITVTSQLPAIITCPVPRYMPFPAGLRSALLRISAMFICGIAAM
jgi:hypothetical protein